MVSPAASWPRTALTVTRVSRMHGRPLIRFGLMVIRSYATVSAYARRPAAAQRTVSAPTHRHLPNDHHPSARRSAFGKYRTPNATSDRRFGRYATDIHDHTRCLL